MSTSDERLLTATELAGEFGTTARALRFYEVKGLLKPQRVGSRRAYGRRDRGRLQLILRGKRLGFSLAEIKEYLELYDADVGQHEQMHRLADLVAARIAELESQRIALDATLAELHDIRNRVEEALAGAGVAEPGAANTPHAD